MHGQVLDLTIDHRVRSLNDVLVLRDGLIDITFDLVLVDELDALELWNVVLTDILTITQDRDAIADGVNLL